MQGVGPPLVTPFTVDGAIDEPALRELVARVEDGGVDFVVPCGSNGEAELMTPDERARVVEIVCEEASVPVLAGTGAPGFVETRDLTERAARAGADAALVVTPFYYTHDAMTLEAYYEDLAEAVDLPLYLYVVPSRTGVDLDPGVVAALAAHPGIEGMKDSRGDIERLAREHRLTEDVTFDLLVGAGGVLAHGLDAGASGGVAALANLVPERVSEIYERHASGETAAARDLNTDLIDLNRAVTEEYGVPGLKAAMRAEGAPAGYPRRPNRPVGEEARERLSDLLSTV